MTSHHRISRPRSPRYEYCGAKNLPHGRTGKLICAPTEADAHHIPKLKEIGDANGVEGLRILTAEEATALEPNVKVHSALYSPNTGIADFGAVARAIAGEIDATEGSSVRVQCKKKRERRGWCLLFALFGWSRRVDGYSSPTVPPSNLAV